MTSSAPVLRTFQILTVSACGMACLLALLPAAGHDQMWLLYAARLHLAGASLYGPELFETNPPLAIWLSAIPELLARLFHLPDTAVAKLLVCLIAAVIASSCWRLLRPLFPTLTRPALWWLAFTFVCLIGVAPARDFGQRDHLLALLVLPYLGAAARRAQALPLARLPAILVGIAAALGICLKPHHALIPIAIESLLLAWSLTRRTPTPRRLPFLGPETLTLVAIGLAYPLAVRLLTPRYFTDILPIARDTYWAFHQPRLSGVLTTAAQLHVLILIDLATALIIRRVPRLAAIFLAAGAASTAAYYLQGTGWYYQQLPALTFFGLALAFLLVELARLGNSPADPTFAQAGSVQKPGSVLNPGRAANHPSHWLPYAAAALGTLALVLTAHFMDYPFTPARSFPIDTPDPVFFANLAPGTPVATLTTTVDYTVPPVFRYGLTLAQRYPHLWMLPAILRNEDPGLVSTGPTQLQPQPLTHPIPPSRLAELDATQHRFMAEDLARWQPRLLLVERCQDSTVHCQVLEDRHDNLLGWFLRDPAFRAEFAHFRYWRSAGPFDAYLRIDPAPSR